MTTDQRLARLERQCRLFKAGFALTAITLVTVLLVGAGQDQEKEKPKVLDEVRTKTLLICDESGKKRAFLWATQEGASLGIYDKDGKWRIALGTYINGPSIGILDRSERMRLVLGCHHGIRSRSGLPDRITPESTATFYGKDGKVIFQVPK